ncbi:MAG: hypothetical protein N2380_00375 [bacterium]|nr:hypothetical protein [bacterium]
MFLIEGAQIRFMLTISGEKTESSYIKKNTIALTSNPNAGKSVVFNRLSDRNQMFIFSFFVTLYVLYLATIETLRKELSKSTISGFI